MICDGIAKYWSGGANWVAYLEIIAANCCSFYEQIKAELRFFSFFFLCIWCGLQQGQEPSVIPHYVLQLAEADSWWTKIDVRAAVSGESGSWPWRITVQNVFDFIWEEIKGLAEMVYGHVFPLSLLGKHAGEWDHAWREMDECGGRRNDLDDFLTLNIIYWCLSS